MEKASTNTTYCFVDEAGDPTLFSAKGKVLIGSPGCSQWFMLGLLEVPNPRALRRQMEQLRRELIHDPYFIGVPSFDPRQNKTAVAFHAKDDLPEVRREVFRLLRGFEGLRFFAVVKNKQAVLESVRRREQFNPTYRYHPNELYNRLVRRLSEMYLHEAGEYDICFASRGRKDRTKALESELCKTQTRISHVHVSNIKVRASLAKQNSSLQAVDYFLWALQRLYTKGEARYWNYIWSACQFVIDIDDPREGTDGVCYTQKKPLTKAALSDRAPWDTCQKR